MKVESYMMIDWIIIHYLSVEIEKLSGNIMMTNVHQEWYKFFG
jgi:hypothetical protein